MKGNERYLSISTQTKEDSGSCALMDIEQLIAFLIQPASVGIDGLGGGPAADTQLSGMGVVRESQLDVVFARYSMSPMERVVT